MRLFIILLLSVNLTPLFSQKVIDTVYLNQNFEKTKKAKATYYRCISKDSASGLYRIMDYQKSGELFKMGLFTEKTAQTPHGIIAKFYPNGKVKHEAVYVDGKLQGPVKSYYSNGNVMRSESYENNILVAGKYFTADGKDTTLLPYFRYPYFKEGNTALQKLLHDEIVYPNDASLRRLEGSVNLGFMVRKNGYIDHVGVLSSTDDIFNKEAIRVMGLTKFKWIPGIDEGETTEMAVRFTVKFTMK